MPKIFYPPRSFTPRWQFLPAARGEILKAPVHPLHATMMTMRGARLTSFCATLPKSRPAKVLPSARR